MECNVKCALAQLRAMKGDIGAARALYRDSRAILKDLERGVMAAASGVDVMRVELLGGDLEAAEREGAADYEFLAGIGETYYRATVAAVLSCVVRDQGRDGEALEWSKRAEEVMAPDEIDTQAYWRAIRAPILARAGDLLQAEEMARSAVDMAHRTEAIVLQGETLLELAAVLHIAGKTEDARKYYGDALAAFEQKGNVTAAETVRAKLSTLPA